MAKQSSNAPSYVLEGFSEKDKENNK